MLQLRVLIGVGSGAERRIELAIELLNHGALESIHQKDSVLASTQKNVHAVGREFHGLDLLRLVLYRESLKRSVLVVLGVKEMDHLV